MVGTLEDIVGKVKEQQLGPPAVIVVGDVVRLREKLRWFDNRPLWGKRILVTRARNQANALSQLLAEYGAQPVELPAIDIQPLSDNKELDSDNLEFIPTSMDNFYQRERSGTIL